MVRKFKEGRYKTRDENEAEICYVSDDRLYGWVHTPDGSYSEKWEPNGRILQYEELGKDIISRRRIKN